MMNEKLNALTDEVLKAQKRGCNLTMSTILQADGTVFVHVDEWNKKETKIKRVIGSYVYLKSGVSAPWGFSIDQLIKEVSEL